VTAQWSVFGYSFPKTSVSVTFSLYPGLTDWGISSPHGPG